MSSNTRDPREGAKSLDTMIRQKAAIVARQEFDKWLATMFTGKAHASSWNKDFTYENYKSIQELLEKFKEGIVVPKAEQDAVNEFLATYRQLQAEFPHLAEQADGEA